MKWKIIKQDAEGIRAIQSGLYIIAKHGRTEVSYMLSRTDMPDPLGFFMTSDEAKQAAADDHMLFGGA